MTTELIHGGISLSDLLHRPSDSESTDRSTRQVPLLNPHQAEAEGGTQAEMTTLSPIQDGQNGKEEDLHICGSHWLSAPLAFTELEVSVSSSAVPSYCFHGAVGWQGPQLFHSTDKAIKA